MNKEVECIDCGCDIQFDPTRKEQRCDQCEDHHIGVCGGDCPVLGCLNAKDKKYDS